MYARILLALALALLLLAGDQGLLFAQSITVDPGPQQQPQSPIQMPMQQAPQQQNPCETEFRTLRTELENRGKSLQEAGKRKASPKELCARLSGYAASESKMLKFFVSKAQTCGVPPEAAENLKKSQVKTAELRTKVCNAANNPQQQQQQSPSTGLSGALNQNTGAVPETPQGGGIFDTLSGNVLQQ
ncbi:MAG: hypothetical protein KF835_05565 [Xanthobacteraceae bacterium]|nr:hypothetical protein [Xanthobacteraceae bacterium]